MVNEPRIDPQRQEDARAYAAQRRKLLAAELALSALLLLGFLLSGASAGLRNTLLGVGLRSPWALVAAYVSVVYIGYTFLSWPLDWWGEYILPHRYGLSTQTPRSWFSDRLKMLVLGLALAVLAAQVIYWLLRTDPAGWWLKAGAFLVGLSVLLGYLLPVLILPLFYRLTPLDNPDLVARIHRLGERAGQDLAGVYTIDLSSRTTAANAAVMGLGRTRRIALGDTLYETYTPEEIETIIAHELGHQVRHDVELSTLVQSAILLGGLYLGHLLLGWGVQRFGFEGPGDVAAMPLLLLAMGISSLIALPLANGYSRWREHLADRYAIALTRRPDAFRRAMLRLANQNMAEFDPPRWVVWLLYSHPPLEERVELARREMAAPEP